MTISSQCSPPFKISLSCFSCRPHWAQRVRDWLNLNLPQKWIGRGNSRDTNIPWPARSPDLTPMDFFVWGFIKSKVYVRNYENMTHLEALIVVAFQEFTAEMVSSIFKNMEKRLKLIIQRQGGHIKNQ